MAKRDIADENKIENLNTIINHIDNVNAQINAKGVNDYSITFGNNKSFRNNNQIEIIASLNPNDKKFHLTVNSKSGKKTELKTIKDITELGVDKNMAMTMLTLNDLGIKHDMKVNGNPSYTLASLGIAVVDTLNREAKEKGEKGNLCLTTNNKDSVRIEKELDNGEYLSFRINNQKISLDRNALPLSLEETTYKLTNNPLDYMTYGIKLENSNHMITEHNLDKIKSNLPQASQKDVDEICNAVVLLADAYIKHLELDGMKKLEDISKIISKTFNTNISNEQITADYFDKKLSLNAINNMLIWNPNTTANDAYEIINYVNNAEKNNVSETICREEVNKICKQLQDAIDRINLHGENIPEAEKKHFENEICNKFKILSFVKEHRTIDINDFIDFHLGKTKTKIEMPYLAKSVLSPLDNFIKRKDNNQHQNLYGILKNNLSDDELKKLNLNEPTNESTLELHWENDNKKANALQYEEVLEKTNNIKVMIALTTNILNKEQYALIANELVKNYLTTGKDMENNQHPTSLTPPITNKNITDEINRLLTGVEDDLQKMIVDLLNQKQGSQVWENLKHDINDLDKARLVFFELNDNNKDNEKAIATLITSYVRNAINKGNKYFIEKLIEHEKNTIADYTFEDKENIDLLKYNSLENTMDFQTPNGDFRINMGTHGIMKLDSIEKSTNEKPHSEFNKPKKSKADIELD